MEYTLEYPDVAPERIDKYINTQISECGGNRKWNV